MKKHRLICLSLSLFLFCAACSYDQRPDDPVSLQNPVAEHPPQYSAALAEALADQPDEADLDIQRPVLLYLEQRRRLRHRNGISEPRLRRRLFPTFPPQYYIAWRGEGDEAVSAVFNAEGSRVTSYDTREVLALGGDILVRGGGSG